MSGRSYRKAKRESAIRANNKAVKSSAGRDMYFEQSRKRAETQRLIEKYQKNSG